MWGISVQEKLCARVGSSIACCWSSITRVRKIRLHSLQTVRRALGQPAFPAETAPPLAVLLLQRCSLCSEGKHSWGSASCFSLFSWVQVTSLLAEMTFGVPFCVFSQVWLFYDLTCEMCTQRYGFQKGWCQITLRRAAAMWNGVGLVFHTHISDPQHRSAE